ncbi:porin [Paraburkholderia sp. CNPSo 3274]|uniref:porin n=1 Tax=Paraburkholderia sp. CNPSo 3274 TaxID=2940932 RepID=UPI0020B779B0|nr:porin [Paraburkholderia sp. CNPSo 3274]MCP3713519.1 porin [Paraburkholderia sp. CNPSo 3274]
MYQLAGVDLTQIHGIGPYLAVRLVAECGTDLGRWPTAKHFTSWLTLSPGCKLSGGKVLSSHTRKTTNRVAALLRLAAVTVGKTSTALGAFYRRLAARIGKAKAVTATARKIAVLFYNAMRFGMQYVDPGADHYEQRYKERVIKQLHRRAAEFGLSRNAFVGLDDDHLGRLTLGNQYDFMIDSLFFGLNDGAIYAEGIYDFRNGPFARLALPNNPTGAFDWDGMAGSRPIRNSVKYASPRFGGFSAGAMYGFGGVAGSFGSNSGVSVGLNYVHGAFGANAAYTQVETDVSGAQVSVRNWGAGAHYTFGQVTANALYTAVRNEMNGASVWQAELGGMWLMASEWVLSGTYMYMKGNQVGLRLTTGTEEERASGPPASPDARIVAKRSSRTCRSNSLIELSANSGTRTLIPAPGAAVIWRGFLVLHEINEMFCISNSGQRNVGKTHDFMAGKDVKRFHHERC